MSKGNRSFKVGEDVYDIPETDVQSFLKDNPKATEIKSYKSGTDTYDIPLNQVNQFIKENPQAAPLDEGAKKKSAGFWYAFYAWLCQCPIRFRSPIYIRVGTRERVGETEA